MPGPLSSIVVLRRFVLEARVVHRRSLIGEYAAVDP